MRGLEPTQKIKPLPKCARPRAVTPVEKAAIVQMAGEGYNVAEISQKLDRDRTTIYKQIKSLGDLIAERQEFLYADRLEDYTNIIGLALWRITQRLATEELASKLELKELVRCVQVMFDKRQLLRKEPTAIHKNEADVPTAELDLLATVEQFNENFKALNQIRIDARQVESGEGDEPEEIAENGEVVDPE